MFGLVVLLLIGAYLAISVAVVKKAMRWAQSSGRSARRWGWIAGLAMYLLVFWDLIPTIALHQYLCATEQGLWIYKTVEEWQRENPGVAETLTATSLSKSYTKPGIARGYVLNQRIGWEIITKKQPVGLLPVFVHEEQIIDRIDGSVLAKHRKIGSGYGSLAIGKKGAWKFWLKLPDCNESRKAFSDYLSAIKSQGETE